jgi:hypothetical protein
MVISTFETWISGITKDRIVTISKQEVFTRAGKEVARGAVIPLTVIPGGIEAVGEFIGIETGEPSQDSRMTALSDTGENWIINTINALHPPDFVAEYREKHANNAASAMAMQEGG